MREIVTPKGDIYARVEVRDGKLVIHMSTGYQVVMDAKVIPQLRQILTEAEFFKVV
jgi:hypothetical protein